MVIDDDDHDKEHLSPHLDCICCRVDRMQNRRLVSVYWAETLEVMRNIDEFAIRRPYYNVIPYHVEYGRL